MKLNITKILLTFLFASCTVSNTSTKISKNESVYSITLQSAQYDSIYQILNNHFQDFPKKDNGEKISYNTNESNITFKVNLTNTKFKMVSRGSNNSDGKFAAIKTEIETIRNQ